ncbi:MAG: ATP-binding protein [Motiliproteus sp.]
MNSQKKLPVVWLLGANALIVLLIMAVGNWWWWERLEHLDVDIKKAAATTSESKTTLLELMRRQLPLHQLLSSSTLQTNRFVGELEHLLLDPARDYAPLRVLFADILQTSQQVEAAWPPTMDAKLLNAYLTNTAILSDIVYEVLETISPIQLQLLVEDSAETLRELIAVMGRIEQQSGQLFAAAERKMIGLTEASNTNMSHMDESLAQIRQQSLLFIVFGSLLIVSIQWLLFRALRQRLAGVTRVMGTITESGSLETRVEHAQKGDLIGDIALVFNTMLERLQRTREALQEEKERAESATRAKSDFLANMSHEIRTPVHAITSLIHLMKEQRLTPKLKSYADKTEVASEALLHVINDVLDFSKVTEGKLELERRAFSLQPSLEKLIDVFSGKFNDKGLDLVVSVESGVPNWVLGDRLRLNQILINLINNAFKFTRSGAVSLNVSCRERSAERVTLAFSVCDTGIGIDQSRIDTLFDAFSQADATTTRKYGGTGLGLTISKRLSELMSGDIHVVSQPERGSTFTLTAQFDLSDRSDQTFIPPLPVSVHDRRVLLLCFEGAQQQMLEATLRDWRLQPMSVQSLDQAQAAMALEPGHCDNVLLLIDVPAGAVAPLESILEELSQHALLWSLPMIFLSQTGLRAETAREVLVVDRPVKRSELYDAVASALGQELRVEKIDATGQSQQERQRIQKQIAGARILVVDDVIINQQIAAEILSRVGIHVSVADNGQQALDLLERECFDLVLMDLQMPILGGLEATQQIRARPHLEQLPVVAMTANVIKGVIEDCQAAGCNDYLSKPLEMDRLWEVLGQWIPAADRTPYRMDSAAQESEASGLSLPEQLPGIEIATALARVGGNAALYCTLLQDFQRQYRGVDEQLRELILQRDYADTWRLAHSLKGVASNLGIMELAQAAKVIEHQAKALSEEQEAAADGASVESAEKSAAQFEPMLVDLYHHLARVERSIAQIAPTASRRASSHALSEPDAPAIDYAQIKPKLEALALLINESNADSLDHYEQLKPQLACGALLGYSEQLESHLNSFLFDQAGNALTALRQHLEAQ